MAIDLPETIPTIINNLRKSNVAIQKFARTFKPQDRISRNGRPKSCKSEQCRGGLPLNCKECQNKGNDAIVEDRTECSNYSSEGPLNGERDCEQSLLGHVESHLKNIPKIYDWNLGSKKPREELPRFVDKERSDEQSLNSPGEISRRRKRVFLLSSIGLALISLAIFIRLFDPLEKILNWKLSLAPGTFALNLWLAPPVTIYVKIYIFNFTNPNEFFLGKEKLRVEQLGPYVYAEKLENTNPIFHPNGTLSYIPRRTVSYVPEMSVADPKSVLVNVPNIPFLGLASMLSDSSVFPNLAFMTLSKYLGSKPFLNLTVYDYLWGYDDTLVKMANKVVSTKIPFSRFGLLDRMYDEGDNLITIRLSDNGLQMTDKGYLPQYTIDTWNGSPGLSNWGYRPEDFKSEGPVRLEAEERCKLIRGASEGVIFPRNVSPKIVHQIYRKSFCRMIPLVFEKEGTAKNGIPAYWYKLPEDVFDSAESNPAQACYCNPKLSTCLPKGLSDITPCYYNIPAAVSFPHFLAADPKLLEDIDGLSPDKEKHGTNIMLQPNLGMPMQFQTRIQTNIVMKKIRYNSKIAPFSNLTLPIVWIELELEGLPTYIVVLLYLIVFVIPALLTAIVVISFVSGLSFLVYSIVSLCLLEGCVNVTTANASSSYASMRISPIINKKKIMSLYQSKAQFCLPLT